MTDVRAITPDEAASTKAQALPVAVIDCWNKLISAAFDGKRAIVWQSEAVAALMISTGEIKQSNVFEKHWLDIEPLYREAGWRVDYDKPGYNESREAYFTFSV